MHDVGAVHFVQLDYVDSKEKQGRQDLPVSRVSADGAVSEG